MVPVLSSISTSMSPAASTARPEVASTFFCTSRSMPAMPMAESSPPMVVGMRHTSSATSAPTPSEPPKKRARGSRVATATRKISVSAARRMVSAISLGVFWRSAPSTRAIIRSMKPPPGSWAISILSQSESTRVPPVTALRSPPASRTTGALSPVMALSSTEAMPSRISPSAGTSCPASTRTTSPRLSSVAATSLPCPAILPVASLVASPTWRMRTAVVVVRIFRSVAAWALPRPSAMASAKLAKSTVNHSQRMSWTLNLTSTGAPRARS